LKERLNLSLDYQVMSNMSSLIKRDQVLAGNIYINILFYLIYIILFFRISSFFNGLKSSSKTIMKEIENPRSSIKISENICDSDKLFISGDCGYYKDITCEFYYGEPDEINNMLDHYFKGSKY